MRGFVCVLACVAALAAQSQAQLPPFGGNPGQPGGNPRGQPGLGGPAAPASPSDPNANCTKCPELWMEHKGCCYRFDSGAISTAPTATGRVLINPTDGLTQAAANMECGRMQPGASLVTVNNLEENNFLFEWAVRMMAQPDKVWIGLHVDPITNTLQWYSGEPVVFTNWEMGQNHQIGDGATLFDADPIHAVHNQVDITAKWVPESIDNRRAYICEYNPQPVMEAPTTPRMTTGAASPAPVMLNNPVNILNGGIFGGSRLHEVPRKQQNRPVNYRMNPYYGVMP